jgi:hypothetical protein
MSNLSLLGTSRLALVSGYKSVGEKGSRWSVNPSLGFWNKQTTLMAKILRHVHSPPSLLFLIWGAVVRSSSFVAASVGMESLATVLCAPTFTDLLQNVLF